MIVHNSANLPISKVVWRCCRHLLCHWSQGFLQKWIWALFFQAKWVGGVASCVIIKDKVIQHFFNTNFFSNRNFKLSSSDYSSPAKEWVERNELNERPWWTKNASHWAHNVGNSNCTQCLSLYPFHKPLPPGPDPIGEKNRPRRRRAADK